MPTAKQCHDLTDYYVTLYSQHYSRPPKINRHTARWGFDSVLLSMDKNQAKALLEYYFRTANSTLHSAEWFFYHYTELEEAFEKWRFDEVARKQLREESRLRAEEWRRKLDQS